MIIISIDSINHSGIATTLAVILTSNLKFAEVRGNTVIEAGMAGLKIDSVVNASQVITVDKSLFSEFIGQVPATLMWKIENGLRFVQGL